MLRSSVSPAEWRPPGFLSFRWVGVLGTVLGLVPLAWILLVLWIVGIFDAPSAVNPTPAGGKSVSTLSLLIALILPTVFGVTGFAWLLADRITRPLFQLNSLLEALIEQSTPKVPDQSQLPRPTSPDALTPTLNRLIDQLEVSREQRLELSLLKRGFEEATEESRARSAFFANMSHEIRTPMSAVQGYAHLLLDPTLTQTERFDYVQTIRRNSDHLLSVVNDILDFSKLEAGRMEFELTECSPGRVVNEVASLFRERARLKGLTLEVQALTPLPESIQSDPTRLRQILLNLLGNAIKFTHTGSIKVMVQYWDSGDDRSQPKGLLPSESPPSGSLSSGAHLSIAIQDSGIGIDPARIGALFQPFTQAAVSTSRLFGGTGLGLVISRRLARLLGGDIQVISDGKTGSTFTLTIKTNRASTLKRYDFQGHESLGDELTDDLSISPLIHTPLLRLDASILLAEDTPDSRVLLKTLLKKVGARVTEAENGRQALKKGLEAWRMGTPYQVILMDMQMPEMDGFEATTRLRTEGYPGAIVALTAFATAGERERCLKAGCNVYLTKPVDRDKLFEVIQSYTPTYDWLSSMPIPTQAPPAQPKPPASDSSSAPEASLKPLPSEAPPSTALLPAPSPDPLPALYSELDGEADLLPLITLFVEDLPERCKKLQTAALEQDLTQVQWLAHQLRGVAGGFGFGSLTDAAGTLEDSITRGEHLDIVSGHLAALLEMCSRVRIRPG